MVSESDDTLASNSAGKEHSERRNFRRIDFDGRVTIRQFDSTSDYLESIWEARLLDISLKGVLVSRPMDWDGSANQYLVTLELPDSDQRMEMVGKLSHEDQDAIGLVCTRISIESATLLRRIIELNVGDTDLLQREFAGLIDYCRDTDQA